MLSVKGTYDGKVLTLTESLEIKEPKEVIITFLETDDELIHDHIINMAEQGGAFDFLQHEEEDIYSDKDLKVPYK